MRLLGGAARFWVPISVGFLCLFAGAFVGTVAAWLLLILAFGLILDGATAMWARAGGTGNLSDHRQ